MMFTSPPTPKKYYVIVGEFGNEEWFLYNVDNDPHPTRQWTSSAIRAIHFKSRDEAEQIGELVCNEDEFSIASFIQYK